MADTSHRMAQDLRRRINDQLEEFWQKIGTQHTGVSGRVYQGIPTETDVSTDTEGLRIEMEVPGMDVADIEISVRDRVLIVSGEKHAEREVEERTYYLSERAYGRFERQFALPEFVDEDKIAANCRNGVLTITAPVKSGTRSSARRIEIRT